MEYPSEHLNELTRGKRFTADNMRDLLGSLGPSTNSRLAEMTPGTCVGLAPELVDHTEV